MFNEIRIAQAEFQLRNAKFNNTKETEGMTVQVPNIVVCAFCNIRITTT